jgi:hypothetical protein
MNFLLSTSILKTTMLRRIMLSVMQRRVVWYNFAEVSVENSAGKGRVLLAGRLTSILVHLEM